MLGSLGMADSLILMVLALVVFGPRRLPQIGRQIGKLMYEFRKASNDFKFQMEEELRLSEDADRRKKEEAERARNLALNPPAQTVEAEAGIGAVEQASVSAPPPAEASPYPGEGTYPAQYPPETAAATQELPVAHPRINPPSTGEPIPAARPGTAAQPEGAAPGIESEPPPAVTEAGTAGSTPVAPESSATSPEGASSDLISEPTRTEHVTHHG